VILTAGHCVYSKGGVDGDLPHIYYDVASYSIVPGNYWDGQGQSGRAPYGQWSVKNMWAANEYQGDTVGGDWGIIEVNPNGQQYPGDVVGTLNARWNYSFPTGSELYLTGYPASAGFRSATYGSGNAQYFCDMHWTRVDGDKNGYAPTVFGTSYAVDSEPCKLTGGASGGPQFVRQEDGSWVIFAVNNRGKDSNGDTLDSWGVNTLGFWFESRFGAFWQDVIAQIEAGA
jgi:hypothetical protein